MWTTIATPETTVEAFVAILLCTQEIEEVLGSLGKVKASVKTKITKAIEKIRKYVE